MRKILLFVLLVLLAWVATPVAADTTREPFKWFAGFGPVFSPDGVAPEISFIGLKPKWGFSFDIGMVVVEDVKCAGAALFCEALNGSPVNGEHSHMLSYRHHSQPTGPLVTFSDEINWTVGFKVYFAFQKKR